MHTLKPHLNDLQSTGRQNATAVAITTEFIYCCHCCRCALSISLKLLDITELQFLLVRQDAEVSCGWMLDWDNYCRLAATLYTVSLPLYTLIPSAWIFLASTIFHCANVVWHGTPHRNTTREAKFYVFCDEIDLIKSLGI